MANDNSFQSTENAYRPLGWGNNRGERNEGGRVFLRYPYVVLSSVTSFPVVTAQYGYAILREIH